MRCEAQGGGMVSIKSRVVLCLAAVAAAAACGGPAPQPAAAEEQRAGAEQLRAASRERHAGSHGRGDDKRRARAFALSLGGDLNTEPILSTRLRFQAPAPLRTVRVPEPSALSTFVRDRSAAIALGKSFFWDTQSGSDGKTACATCHFHAGADVRVTNQVNPGPDNRFTKGPMATLSKRDFPFHRLADPAESGSKVLFDTDDVTGSQGVVKKQYVGPVYGKGLEHGKTIHDPVFNLHGTNVRQVTGRNTPTMIGAVFNYRNFWDGRANNFFNGVSPFGARDHNAAVWTSDGGELTPTRILLENSSLASQAVGPPGNNVEMSWNGRPFPMLGRKMLALQPLAEQYVDPDDSVLGPLAVPDASGLWMDYAQLIQTAFEPAWWQGTGLTPDGYTQMEANFSLYWGLAIQSYEATLIPDGTPYDRWADGDDSAMTFSQKQGLDVFFNKASCFACHSGPEFTSATLTSLTDIDHQFQVIERMVMANLTAVYDHGFYNIGVRPTSEDKGTGGEDPFGNPLSFTRQFTGGRLLDPVMVDPCKHMDVAPCMPIQRGETTAVDGSFKTPSLRNVELTGPYMHNGGMATLQDVVHFYSRGGDFRETNAAELAADFQPIFFFENEDAVGRRLTEDELSSLADFLTALTDDRVRSQSAPFDHPEIDVPHGPHLDAVGAYGSEPLKRFDELLRP